MSGRFEALALPEVRRLSVETALRAEGVEWYDASHVAATGSLAQRIRTTGTPAIAIAHLIDLVVWSGMEPDYAVAVTEFPSVELLTPGDDRSYQTELTRWRSMMTGRRMNLGMVSDLALRRFLREHASDRRAAEVLLRAQREFRKSVQTLIAADIRPTDFDPVDPMSKVAVEAWAGLETRVPALTAVRDDLWTEPVHLAEQPTPQGARLSVRLADSMNRAFGPARGRRSIVHHGFYFFTPPQWALFQLLRGLPDVDQYFVVHDDGSNPAFETWRRFFLERWKMPVLRHVSMPSKPTAAALALLDSLEGRHVDASRFGTCIRVVEHQTSAEFVRDLTERSATAAAAGSGLAVFAAEAADVERLVERLGPVAVSGVVDLAHLPVGQFLLSVHAAITPREGRIDFVLAPEQILDIASSGFLDTGESTSDPGANIGALRRCMPFFRGCHSLTDWTDRASALERLVLDEVAQLGARDDDQSDRVRINVATRNPLRRVPWADLTAGEARAVAGTVRRVARLVEEIASYESKSIKDYLEFVRGQLQRGMVGLDDRQRSEINEKLRGFVSGGDAEMDVEGLVDVVKMLLAREADFDHTGETATEPRAVNELRGLDVYGLEMSERDLFVANLAEGVYPSGLALVGWPFRPMDLLDVEDGLPPVSMEIMRARVDTAAISDLYLFWLALDAIPEGRTMTLSWIAQAGSELRNPSPILNLLRQPDHWSDAVRTVAGGLTTARAGPNSYDAVVRAHPPTRDLSISAADASRALRGIDPTAVAVGHACPRRFALQWALGESGSFLSEHNQIMLFGNVMGALVRLEMLTETRARQVCKDLWRHLSTGERVSSYYRRVVESHSGPRPEWTMFLEGSKWRRDPLSLAYRAAIGENAGPTIDEIASTDVGVLPPRPDTNRDICRNCPVRDRCAAAMRPE